MWITNQLSPSQLAQLDITATMPRMTTAEHDRTDGSIHKDKCNLDGSHAMSVAFYIAGVFDRTCTVRCTCTTCTSWGENRSKTGLTLMAFAYPLDKVQEGTYYRAPAPNAQLDFAEWPARMKPLAPSGRANQVRAPSSSGSVEPHLADSSRVLAWLGSCLSTLFKHHASLVLMIPGPFYVFQGSRHAKLAKIPRQPRHIQKRGQ